MTREDQLLLDEMGIYCSPAVPSLRKGMGLGSHTLGQRLSAYESIVLVLLARLKKTDMALQSLTPGGSEYVANPDLCVRRAKETCERYREMLLEALQERNAERDKRIDLERQMQDMVPLNPET